MVRKGGKARAEIPISANDRSVAMTLKRVVTNFKKSSTEINQSLELVGKGWRVISAVPAAITRHMIEATKAANVYGRAVAEVTTIASESEFPLQKIRDITFEMTALYGSDATGNAKALYQTISAGASTAAQAQDILHSASKLAIGGVTNTTIAVDALTNTVNAYAATNARAADVADAFFVAIRDGKTTADELAASIGGVAPVAAQLGVDFDVLLASVATITTNGVATAEAFTQVRSALVGVIKESPKAKRAAKDLGIDFSVAALRAKGFRKFLQDIADSGATEAQLLALFGRTEALGAVMALSNQEFKKFDETLGDMEKRAGSADEAFKKMSGTLDFQITRFQALRQAAQIALGQTVTDSKNAFEAISVVNEELTDFIQFLSEPEGKAAINDFFVLVSTAAGAALTTVAGLLEAVTFLRNQAKMIAHDTLGIGDGVLVEGVGPSLADRVQRLADRLFNVGNGARGSRGSFGGGGRNVLGAGGGGRGGGGGGGGKGKVTRLTPEALITLGEFGIEALDVADATAAQRAMAPAIQGQKDFQPSFRAGSTAGVARDFLSILGLPSVAEFKSYFGDLKDGMVSGLKALGTTASDFGTVIGDTLGGALQGVGAAFAEMLVQWDAGAFSKKLGEVLVGLGTMLVQTGVAASVLGALSFIPGLQLVTGPPGLAVAGGLLSAGAGAAMILAGKALGGGGAASAASSSSRVGGGGGGGGRGGGGQFAPSVSSGGFNPAFAAAGAGGGAQEVHIHFPGFVGDRKRAIREAREALREGEISEPFGVSGR